MKIVIIKLLFLFFIFRNFQNKELPLVIEKNWTKFYLGYFENHVKCQQWDQYVHTRQIKKIFLNLITYQLKPIGQISDQIEYNFDFIQPTQNLQIEDEQYFDWIDFTKVKQKSESFSIVFDIDFEVDQSLEYSIFIKTIQIQENNQQQDALVIYIAAYQYFFDISLREFVWKDDHWVLQFYRGLENQNLHHRIKVKRFSCDVPKNYDNKKVSVIRDSLKKEVPYTTKQKKIYFYLEQLTDLPEYFQNKLLIPNAFYFTGSNNENYTTCKVNYNELQNLDKTEIEDDDKYVDENPEQQGLEIVAKVVSATLRYSIERDFYRESLNQDDKPCYNFRAQYEEESQRNIAFIDSYPLGCLDHDIQIEIQDLYYENSQDIGSTWYQLVGQKQESKIKKIIIHKGTHGFYFKNKQLYLPHFTTLGRFFPIMIHNKNKYKFHLYFSPQNLFQIQQTDKQSFLIDVVSLQKLSLRDYVSQDDHKVICQRSKYLSDGTVKTSVDFKMEDNEKINILIIDEYNEQSSTKNKLMDFHYVMTYSQQFVNQQFYGPFAYSNNTAFMCWQKIEENSVEYIVLPASIDIPFKYPLIFLKKIDNDIVFQLYKNYTSLDLVCSIPESETQITDDYNIFNFNISVNYINKEQDYLSWSTQYKQRQEWNMNDLKQSLVFVLRQANVNLKQNITECEILSRDQEILINIHVHGIDKEDEDDQQDSQEERKLQSPLQLEHNQIIKEVKKQKQIQKIEKKII